MNNKQSDELQPSSAYNPLCSTNTTKKAPLKNTHKLLSPMFNILILSKSWAILILNPNSHILPSSPQF
jgi:hypothetical protein